MKYGRCWLCGKNGVQDPLDTHHIFGGAYRKKSDKLGLTVRLCHSDCHIFGKNAVHNNRETMRMLHEHGQRVAMERFDWTVEDFRKEFGKNYLDEDAEKEVGQYTEERITPPSRLRRATSPFRGGEGEEIVEVVGFLIFEEAALPF